MLTLTSLSMRLRLGSPRSTSGQLSMPSAFAVGGRSELLPCNPNACWRLVPDAQKISASGHTTTPDQCCSSVKNSCHGAVHTSKPTLYVTLNSGICYHLIDLSVLFCRGRHVRRREFVAFVSGAAPFWPVAARAQDSALPVIGFLSGASLEAMRDYLLNKAWPKRAHRRP